MSFSCNPSLSSSQSFWSSQPTPLTITSSTLLSFLKTFATKVAFQLKPSLHHQCQHPAPNRLSRQDPNLCWMANHKEKWDKTTLCWQKSTFLHQIQQVPASGLSDGSSKDPGCGEHVETSLRHPMLWENMSKISCHQTAFNKEGKSIARRDYLRQAESNSTWRCADCTVWALKKHLLLVYIFYRFSCRATLPSQPKTNQESVLFAATSSSLLCSFVHLQSKPDPVLAPPSLFGGLTSPLSQSLDWKTCIQTCHTVYVLKKFIFRSEEYGAWPRYWKITAPNQTAMTLEETGKPLLCAKPNENTSHFAHFVPGGCPSGKNAEFPHIDADKWQVLPPGWLAGLGM